MSSWVWSHCSGNMYSPRFLSLSLISLLVPASFGVIFTDPSSLPTLTYDYIIVGAGNAGLVLANRLTANPAVTVLVIEAGVSDQGVIAAEAPFLGPTLTPNTLYDWNYTVTPQAGMDNRKFPYPRGRLLGGSSSANYLFHQYGTDEDWNRIATVTGDPGWSWANVQRYIAKHEKVVPPVDGHNTTGQYIPSLHGTNGTLFTSLPGFNQTIDARVINTTIQLPSEFPYNEDTAGGSHSLLGIGWLQSSAGNGSRSSSSTSYLADASSRPNLFVLINSTVSKLLQTGTMGNNLASFRAVQFMSNGPASTIGSMTVSQGNVKTITGRAITSSSTVSSVVGGGTPTSAKGTITSSAAGSQGTATGSSLATITANANKEVILSAGSVGTTQLLLLSGIGNATDLKALGINPIIDNPSVGANLSDHTLLPNIFTVQGNQSFDSLLRDPVAVGKVLTQWEQNKTGLFANNVANNFGFSRLPSNAPIFKNTSDPAAGPNSPHWEVIFANFWFSPEIERPATGSFLTVVNVLVSPTSRGAIKLASSSVFDQPTINPNFLTTAFDIAAMIDSVNATIRFIAAPAWSDYVTGRFGPAFQNATNDTSIASYIRGLTTTIYHPTGTAAMASSAAPIGQGVVNPDFTVKGADGLRVVDASVFPFIPSCHPQGAVYLLAERASCIISSGTETISC